MPSPSDLGQPKDFLLGSCCIERHLVLALPQTPKIAMGKPNGLGWFGAPFLQNLHLWIYHRFPCQKGPFWYPKRPFSEKKHRDFANTEPRATLTHFWHHFIPPLCIASRSPGQPLRAQQFPPRMRQHWQHRETVCPALRESWSREHFLCSHICHKCLRPCCFCQKNGRDMKRLMIFLANLFLLSRIISVQVAWVGEI